MIFVNVSSLRNYLTVQNTLEQTNKKDWPMGVISRRESESEMNFRRKLFKTFFCRYCCHLMCAISECEPDYHGPNDKLMMLVKLR